MKKKLILTTLLITSSVFAGPCYTAQNGFSSISSIANKMKTQTQNSNLKLFELSETINKKEVLEKELLEIEESIKMINQLKIEKQKSIINSLKVKNELKSNSMTIEQILNELKR